MTAHIDHLHADRTLLAALTGRAELTPALRAGAVVLMAALTAVAAQVSIPLPFTPVPVTLQPVVVLLGGAAVGARLGMASQVLYLMAGVAGLPVFAASPVLPQGILRLLGPTGGYLISYPLAAFLAGWLAQRGAGRHYLSSVLAMAAGLAVVYTFGVAWLAWLAQPAGAGLETALRTGFYPFFFKDFMLLFVAAGVLPGVWKLIGR